MSRKKIVVPNLDLAKIRKKREKEEREKKELDALKDLVSHPLKPLTKLKRVAAETNSLNEMFKNAMKSEEEKKKMIILSPEPECELFYSVPKIVLNKRIRGVVRKRKKSKKGRKSPPSKKSRSPEMLFKKRKIKKKNKTRKLIHSASSEIVRDVEPVFVPDGSKSAGTMQPSSSVFTPNSDNLYRVKKSWNLEVPGFGCNKGEPCKNDGSYRKESKKGP